MKDLLKFLAVVVLISAIWGVWTHKRAVARGPMTTELSDADVFGAPVHDPTTVVVWDKTPRAEAPTQKRLFDDVLKPTPGSLPRTAWEIQFDAITSPKTQAGRDRITSLKSDPDWHTLMSDWKLKNPAESAKMDADWKEGVRFLGALKVAVDGHPQASTVSIYWLVDCLVLDKGATTNGCDDNPYEPAAPIYTISGEEKAQHDRKWADIRAQQDRDNLASAQRSAQQDEAYQRERNHREQMRAIENARREAQRAARGY